MADLTPALAGRVLQLYWPDDGSWWIGQVLAVDPPRGVAHVLYNTGEEEAELDVQELIERGEVAWAPPKTQLDQDAVAAAMASAGYGPPPAVAAAAPVQQGSGAASAQAAGGAPNKRKAGGPPSSSSNAPGGPAPKRPRPNPSADPPPSPTQPSSGGGTGPSRPASGGAGKAGGKPPGAKQRPGSGSGSGSGSAGGSAAGRAEVVSLDRLLRMGRDAIGREIEVFVAAERAWKRAQVAHVTGRQSVDVLYREGPLVDGRLHAAHDAEVMLRLLPR